MNSKKFSEAMSELDSKYVDEAISYKKKAKSQFGLMGSYCSLFCSCNRLRCGIVSKWIIWQSYRYSHIE